MSSQSSSRRRAEPTRSLFNLYSSENHQDHLQQDVKPILASSIKVASMGAWELPNSKSPALYAPPDMNSECLLRHIYNALFQVDNIDWICFYPGIVSGQYPLEEGPLSQMSEAVISSFFIQEIYLFHNLRWTTWTSWATQARWVHTPRAPPTPQGFPPHPSPLEPAIRARAVGSTGTHWLAIKL